MSRKRSALVSPLQSLTLGWALARSLKASPMRAYWRAFRAVFYSTLHCRLTAFCSTLAPFLVDTP
jgi:hypothetical protein